MEVLYILLFNFLLLVALTNIGIEGSTLTVSNSMNCVGDSVIFTCVANQTAVLYWFVDPFISKERALSFSSDDPIGRQFIREGFNVTLVNKVQDLSDSIYADLVSTLEVTVTRELNGSRVWCSATGLENSEVFRDIVIKGPPPSLYDVRYTILDSDLHNVTLLIQWNTQSDSAVDTFHIFVYSTTVNYTVHSGEKILILTLPYNESYNISVRAVNCAEEGKAARLQYIISDCGAPHPPLNGYVEPYNSTVEGGEVFYQCREGYSPSDVGMRAVCTAEGVWNPNPAHLLCTRGSGPDEQLEETYTVIISAAIAGSILFILCVFLFGCLFLFLRNKHRRIKSPTNEPPPAMVTVSSDPLYEEIPTQVGEERFVVEENSAYIYGPKPVHVCNAT